MSYTPLYYKEVLFMELQSVSKKLIFFVSSKTFSRIYSFLNSQDLWVWFLLLNRNNYSAELFSTQR